ncbi:MAG: hydroxymethylbilane synthase [Hyperthermus sp.]|nr:MAG: hydroxymethylbilane synthase [Hyperthermus sp.]
MKLRVATRGSKLSRIQTLEALEYVRRRAGTRIDFELVIVKTRGDRYSDRPFTMIGGKGVFEKEVNLAVIEGRADIAVHSMKDVPSDVDPRLVLAAVPPRGSPFDVLVSRGNSAKTLWELAHGAIVGTSSARRAAFLKKARSDLVIKPLRGNVDTRLRKLDSGMYDAIVLAEAGLQRLGVRREYWRIPPEIIPPAPGQGIIGIYSLRQRIELLRILRKTSHQPTLAEAMAERAFLAYAGGGCHVPLGGYAQTVNGRLKFIAGIASANGGEAVMIEVEGDIERPSQLGIEAAFELRRLAGNAGIKY